MRAEVRVIKDGVLVPQRSVMELQGQHSVFIVGEDKTVKRQQIKAGPKVGEFWLINEGLKPGELIVYEGLQKVKEGIVVNPIMQNIKIPEEHNN